MRAQLVRLEEELALGRDLGGQEVALERRAVGGHGDFDERAHAEEREAPVGHARAVMGLADGRGRRVVGYEDGHRDVPVHDGAHGHGVDPVEDGGEDAAGLVVGHARDADADGIDGPEAESDLVERLARGSVDVVDRGLEVVIDVGGAIGQREHMEVLVDEGRPGGGASDVDAEERHMHPLRPRGRYGKDTMFRI